MSATHRYCRQFDGQCRVEFISLENTEPEIPATWLHEWIPWSAKIVSPANTFRTCSSARQERAVTHQLPGLLRRGPPGRARARAPARRSRASRRGRASRFSTDEFRRRELSDRRSLICSFGTNSRERSAPSTDPCAPFLRVAANVERLPHATKRCHSVRRM